MNCREFEQSWNELLDAQSPGVSELERSLEAHASVCGECRAVSSRYQMLRQAVSAWTPPPAPSAESLERLYALTVPSTTLTIPVRRSPLRHWVPLGMAAALFGLAWLGWSARFSGPLPEDSAPASNPVPPIVTHRDPRKWPLGAALAKATKATIDLALEASAPATRISREIFDLDKTNDSESIEKPVETVDAESSASDLLQSVGERVNESVKPFSGSARHAFSFLLGPPPGADPAPTDSQGSL
jgi:hypothetical protein